jgi:L-seryl-tRNA(Ser) seleniumtransferase
MKVPLFQPVSSARLSRRTFFKSSGFAALAGLLRWPLPRLTEAPRITIPTYQSIGVRPIINCLGTHTNRGGSLMLPEVMQAMAEANKHYVRMDELMEGVGGRLAELTGAQWGIITSGAAAAMFAGTCACVAGADPEKMAILPDTTGMKNEVLVPKGHRHIYDRAIWMVGVKMIEAGSLGEMEAAANDRTAMIAVLGEILDQSEISLEDIIALGKKRGIPVLVDAAAERPDVPDRYIKAGADLVAYSGGKCLRGPQGGGILLGRKDLVQAAFLNISPHHALGRPMKAGKEEIMGTLAAMEMWVHGRDHKAEWQQWERTLDHIRQKIASIRSVVTKINSPTLRSNVAPTLSISWDQKAINITPREASDQLYSGEPAIEMPFEDTGLTIMSYMLEPGDEVQVGRRLAEVLSGAVKGKAQ